MDRTTEIALARELAALHAAESAYVDDEVAQSPVDRYVDPDRFALEQRRIFRRVPQPAVHASELPGSGAFVRREVAGLPVLFTRDADGTAHAFLNVCRHRGTRLVDDMQGCRQRFTCPYHAWTFDNRGDLVAVPHEALGFPELPREALGLRRLGCAERHGWIWVWACSEDAPDVDASLAGLAADFAWVDAGQLTVLHTHERACRANWKILVEGGLEAYHFRVAHRDTIGPYFHDNLSSYACFGPHLRSVLAKRTLTDLTGEPDDAWRLRDHAQLLYTVFPTNSFLVQSDHLAWIQLEPLDAATTRVRLSTVVPADRVSSDDDLAHWAKNHDITVRTLTEDFEIGERIQSGLASGANERLTFGRFEGALEKFNASVERRL